MLVIAGNIQHTLKRADTEGLHESQFRIPAAFRFQIGIREESISPHCDGDILLTDGRKAEALSDRCAEGGASGQDTIVDTETKDRFLHKLPVGKIHLPTGATNQNEVLILQQFFLQLGVYGHIVAELRLRKGVIIVSAENPTERTGILVENTCLEGKPDFLEWNKILELIMHQPGAGTLHTFVCIVITVQHTVLQDVSGAVLIGGIADHRINKERVVCGRGQRTFVSTIHIGIRVIPEE